MEHIYHVQHEVTAYYQHIPRVPNTFSVKKDLLFGMTESEFIENFREFTEIMKQMYIDMEKRPEEYGLLIIDINEVNENKADGNLAKASWRSVKRLADVISEIGKLGEIYNESLELPVTEFKASLVKIKKFNLILNRLIDFGFAISNYNGKSFEKNTETFSITNSQNPLLMRVLKAYAISEAFQSDDPHEFYYFDYKRVAQEEKLPAHCVANDLALLLDEDKGKLLVEIEKCFVDDLGLTSHYKDDSIEYYLSSRGKALPFSTMSNKKRVARFMIDFHSRNVELILKLKNMDNYIDKIEELPQNLRTYFEKGNCRYCGFQNSTKEFCKYRVIWTLDDKKHAACNFSCFNFNNPKSEDLHCFVSLIKSEYKL